MKILNRPVECRCTGILKQILLHLWDRDTSAQFSLGPPMWLSAQWRPGIHEDQLWKLWFLLLKVNEQNTLRWSDQGQE